MNMGNSNEPFQDPHRWQQLETILNHVLDMPTNEANVYMTHACSGDPELLKELKSLRAAGQNASDFLETPAIANLDAIFQTETRLVRDIEAIPCRILEKIGEGGMGRVYLIEQSGPLRRLAALKLIPHIWVSESLTRRFKIELEALARMNHENVARFLEAGATPDLRIPYFLMEYFPGKAITTYAREAGLTLQARLELFLQVCAGVSHAHQQGVIHRDLKPGNILVGLKEGLLLAKVIDFGIAKAFSDDLGSCGTNELNQTIGTPFYMSPEQLDPGSVPVDIRSDIYSLGMVLYELITGCQINDRRLLEGRSLCGQLEFLRNYRPPRPSSAVRGETLPHELDWVFAKATQTKKELRYPTVDALAKDIRRILHRMPTKTRLCQINLYPLKQTLSRPRTGYT